MGLLNTLQAPLRRRPRLGQPGVQAQLRPEGARRHHPHHALRQQAGAEQGLLQREFQTGLTDGLDRVHTILIPS